MNVSKYNIILICVFFVKEDKWFFIGRYGGYKDWDSGFINFHNRWYDSELGKWISRDPIGELGGMNLYAYADNNPVKFIDPTGLAPYFSVENYAMNLLWKEVEALQGAFKAFAKCVLYRIVISEAITGGTFQLGDLISGGKVVWKKIAVAGTVVFAFVDVYNLWWCAEKGYKNYF